MKNCLLFLAVVSALLVGGPAYSQYVFLDVDGDGRNSAGGQGGDDVLTPGTYPIDVWFWTNTNRDETAAVCASGEALSIISYSFMLLTSGTGSVTYGTWTDNLGFTVKGTPCAEPYCSAGPAMWVGRGSASALTPGMYKVGTLQVTVTGSPRIDIMPTYPDLDPTGFTGFGSACVGGQFDNTMYLGADFFDANGTDTGTDVKETTWGKIKDLYR
jgi:hypothetical protein